MRDARIGTLRLRKSHWRKSLNRDGMKKVRNIRIIRLTNKELTTAPYSNRIWKRRELIWNTDTDQKRLGTGEHTWSGLAARGAAIVLEVDTIATGNVALTGSCEVGDNVGGVVVTANSVVGLFGQSTPSQNGIYRPGATATRHPDYTTYDAHVGLVVYNKNNGHIYRCTSTAGGTINSTGLAFSRVGTGAIDFSESDMPAGVQQATPAGGDIIFFKDVSEGGVWKWCTLTQLQTLINV